MSPPASAGVRGFHRCGRRRLEQYLNKLLDNLFGFQIPQALSAAPFDEDPGVLNLPAVILMCCARSY